MLLIPLVCIFLFEYYQFAYSHPWWINSLIAFSFSAFELSTFVTVYIVKTEAKNPYSHDISFCGFLNIFNSKLSTIWFCKKVFCVVLSFSWNCSRVHMIVVITDLQFTSSQGACYIRTRTRTRKRTIRLFHVVSIAQTKIIYTYYLLCWKVQKTFHQVNANEQKVYHNIVLYSFVGRLCGIRHIPNDIHLSQRPIVATRQTTKDL